MFFCTVTLFLATARGGSFRASDDPFCLPPCACSVHCVTLSHERRGKMHLHVFLDAFGILLTSSGFMCAEHNVANLKKCSCIFSGSNIRSNVGSNVGSQSSARASQSWPRPPQPPSAAGAIALCFFDFFIPLSAQTPSFENISGRQSSKQTIKTRCFR